ncbi:hypothetical protein L1987_13576 [Smallanthus sonchifolius]|uniref:Uncharacterized protein n=1 Tax=Smallanthus sonchifolius TaxID=185202 RepID=A0ACB9JGU3_9ASTR|nr:hypothetical protein L1987_13576 [Smallanthus sonchifolius]
MIHSYSKSSCDHFEVHNEEEIEEPVNDNVPSPPQQQQQQQQDDETSSSDSDQNVDVILHSGEASENESTESDGDFGPNHDAQLSKVNISAVAFPLIPSLNSKTFWDFRVTFHSL